MKPFNHMEPCTQLTLFVIARRKNIVSDSDGYVKVCIDLITTVLGKRLCYYPWDVEVVPRNIDQDDVEEEGFTKRLRYIWIHIYQSVQHGRFDEFITAS
jgi:hypothetical protein